MCRLIRYLSKAIGNESDTVDCITSVTDVTLPNIILRTTVYTVYLSKNIRNILIDVTLIDVFLLIYMDIGNEISWNF